MDAGNAIALTVGLGGLTVGVYTHASSRAERHRREQKEDRRADRAVWLHDKRAAYAAMLAGSYAFFDELSEEARHVSDAPTPTASDRADQLFADLIAAQGTLDLLAPENVRTLASKSIAATRSFGWTVRDGQRAAINPERKVALAAISDLLNAMRDDLGVVPATDGR